MLGETLIKAIALVCILEGILPFISPSLWRRAVFSLMRQTDDRLRMIGLLSMVIGLFILYIEKFI